MIERPITFPSDEGKHQSITEWWYLNGLLKDESGHEFSYMSTIFHVRYPAVLGGLFKRLPSSDKYFYHGIVTDIAKGKSFPRIEILDSKTAQVATKKMSINLSGSKTSDHYYLSKQLDNQYEMSGNGLHLSFDSLKKPLLVGNTGYVDNVGTETYYYSLPNLKTTGEIELEGGRALVTGRSWMDHQWGDFGAPKGYWNWFSIQLENDIQIVCYESGSKHHKKLLATISWADGSTTSYSNVSITEGSDSWTSPRTGARYPLSWMVVIPEAEVSLTITAKVKDHELNFWYINYWEGPSEIIAMIKDKKIGGSGFIEIVGRRSKSRRYGPIMSFLLGQKVKDQYL